MVKKNKERKKIVSIISDSPLSQIQSYEVTVIFFFHSPYYVYLLVLVCLHFSFLQRHDLDKEDIYFGFYYQTSISSHEPFHPSHNHKRR